MAFQLLGQQVPLGDLQLLLIGIAGQFNDLHPVQQGPGDGIQGVGGGDKEHVGEIEGHLQKMVAEGAVLLGVQHLQQGRGGIAPLIIAQLVDLIQQQQRITALSLLNGGNDAARHGPHIGLAVAADLRLVMDAAQGDTGQLTV